MFIGNGDKLISFYNTNNKKLLAKNIVRIIKKNS